MGKIFIMTNHSGGGADTSAVTATADDVLVGKIIVDAEGETIAGSMPDRGAISQSLNAGGSYTIPKGYHNGSGKINAKTLASQTNGTATAEQILNGSTAYVDGVKITGTMPNQGSKSQSLNAGGSYTIPAGYHDGTGKVTANALSGQTSGTAASADIISERTAWVNGSQITGTMPNNGAVNPSALSAGGSYTIPKGYHNGQGKVTVQSLATLTASGDATAAQILSGKKAYVDGSLITGTMTNNGAVAPSALGAGGSYTIPAGYHNGSGKVTVQTLATMTASGDATAGQILSGKKAYVDGTLLTGSMANQGAKTATYTPSTTVQTYTIPAGYHNGSGKITVNAIPSNYVDIGGGITFFKDGAFGQFVNNVGLGRYRPYSWGTSDGNGWYTITQWLGDKSAITLTDLLGRYTPFPFCVNVINDWGTRKTLNFDNIKTLTLDCYSGGFSTKMRAWFYNVDTQKCKHFDFSALDATLDLSGVNGNCVFGICRTSGSRSYEVTSMIFT